MKIVRVRTSRSCPIPKHLPERHRVLRRTFDTDVLECPKCAGRIRVLAVVDDIAMAAAILTELGHTKTPAPRARDPSTLFGDEQTEPVYDAS